MTLKTFNVGWIFEKFAAQEGVSLIAQGFDGIVCYGLNVSSDKDLRSFLRQHAAPYGYQIVDGDPVRLVRREVNDDLIIDLEIDETECIRRGKAPAVRLRRVEPSDLPRQVEIQYADPDRNFAFNTQVARHTASPVVNTTLSVTLDFAISSQQARDMAFDLLYRIWGQQLALEFEHPNITVEPSDVLQVATTRGTFICLVTKQALNMPARTNTIIAPVLLTSAATSVVTAPTADPFNNNAYDDDAAWLAAA